MRWAEIPNHTIAHYDRKNLIISSNVKQLGHSLLSFWTDLKSVISLEWVITNLLFKISLGQNKFYLFKLQRIDTGECQLKFLCKFSVEKNWPKSRKKSYLTCYRQVHAENIQRGLHQLGNAPLGEETEQLQVVAGGIIFSLFGLMGLRHRDTMGLLDWRIRQFHTYVGPPVFFLLKEWGNLKEQPCSFSK